MQKQYKNPNNEKIQPESLSTDYLRPSGKGGMVPLELGLI